MNSEQQHIFGLKDRRMLLASYYHHNRCPAADGQTRKQQCPFLSSSILKMNSIIPRVLLCPHLDFSVLISSISCCWMATTPIVAQQTNLCTRLKYYVRQRHEIPCVRERMCGIDEQMYIQEEGGQL